MDGAASSMSNYQENAGRKDTPKLRSALNTYAGHQAPRADVEER
jgi:hypothetical protein